MDETVSIVNGKEHPRVLKWLGLTAVALGGSNLGLFILTDIISGQGDISGHGTATIFIYIIGACLSWLALPGWIELILMFPNRVGGIAATCYESFKPYSPILANLTGVCYWWGWVPVCGLAAIWPASIFHEFFLPEIPITLIAVFFVFVFAVINLFGIKITTKTAIAIAFISLPLALLSGIIPIVTGHMNWQQAFTFHLETPFSGLFGQITSFMAGLYLVGFAAPAFEQATCHVGETINPEKNIPWAVYASGAMTGLFFIVLPLIWLGTLGKTALYQKLTVALNPLFYPVFGVFDHFIVLWFLIFSSFHGILAPLAGATRTMAQLAEDDLVPETLALRNRYDAPWVSIVLMTLISILFLVIGNPIWLIAAANFTYLIGICLPSVAVWLLRQDQPSLKRPYKASKISIYLGLFSALVWGLSTILGFEQFGLPTVLVGIFFAYAGSGLYAWRKFMNRRKAGLTSIAPSLHVKLTGAMLLVLGLDAIGYLIAVNSVPLYHTALITGLEDIFVMVAILTISVGLILPGMIAHSVNSVSKVANQLAKFTITDFSKAMVALGKGDLDKAYSRIKTEYIVTHSRDEVSEMANNFNLLQEKIKQAAHALDTAREGLRKTQNNLKESNIKLRELNENLELRVKERTVELEKEIVERKQAEQELQVMSQKLIEIARKAGMAEVATSVLHNIGNVLNAVNISANLLTEKVTDSELKSFPKVATLLDKPMDELIRFIQHDDKGQRLPLYFIKMAQYWQLESNDILKELSLLSKNIQHIKTIISRQQALSGVSGIEEVVDISELIEDALAISIHSNDLKLLSIVRNYEHPMNKSLIDKSKTTQILINLISNAKEALLYSKQELKQIKISIELDDNISIKVEDNGSGITKENLTKIFSYGFTTKKNGHGFGLHACALSAKDMGGSLRVYSKGFEQGTTFTLKLPYKLHKTS